jgi:hypothetical protein
MCVDKNKCTIREIKKAILNPPILYGWIYPNLLMVLMIISTYCCISPLLSPFGLVFYAFAYLMYKYQLLYVYINEYQSGGYMWYAVFNRSMVALIAGVVTLLGYLGIRETFFSGPFYLLAPLPFCISYFWYKCEERFKVASMSLSLESAIDLDRDAALRGADGKPNSNPNPNPNPNRFLFLSLSLSLSLRSLYHFSHFALSLSLSLSHFMVSTLSLTQDYQSLSTLFNKLFSVNHP